MAHLFRKLFMSSQRRRQIKDLLSENAKQLEKNITRINDDERNQRADIMNQYVKDLVEKGDIDSAEADEITEKAQQECDRISEEARKKTEAARQSFKRRADQIWSLR